MYDVRRPVAGAQGGFTLQVRPVMDQRCPADGPGADEGPSLTPGLAEDMDILPVSYTHLDVYKRQVLYDIADITAQQCAEGIQGVGGYMHVFFQPSYLARAEIIMFDQSVLSLSLIHI